MLEIYATVFNEQPRDIGYRGRFYIKESKTPVNLGINEYHGLEKHGDLRVEIENFNYDSLENLTKEELKLVAEYEEIENYWIKKATTLLNDLKKKKEEE